MKLRNKRTGEIVEVESCNSTTGTIGLFFAEGRECDRAYNSLAELNSEWEDYEEPKGIVKVEKSIAPTCVHIEYATEEEAEQAVEKLKAFKRLMDKGLKLELRPGIAGGEIRYHLTEESDETEKDLRTCFGGEE